MNKIMIFIAVAMAAFLVNLGLHVHALTLDIKNQKRGMLMENRGLWAELALKQSLRNSPPKNISNAFDLFVNQTKIFETYSGTRMNIVVGNSKENENIEDYYADSEFRNVKELPLTINVEKFSNETDMAEVLNDIYLLENQTDFKVSEIESENNALIVKGELYGI